jgi:hypothetical protein
VLQWEKTATCDDVFTRVRRCERIWPDDVSYVIKALPAAIRSPIQTENPGAAGMPISNGSGSIGKAFLQDSMFVPDASREVK